MNVYILLSFFTADASDILFPQIRSRRGGRFLDHPIIFWLVLGRLLEDMVGSVFLWFIIIIIIVYFLV